MTSSEREYYIRSDPHGQWVEGWSSWQPPFINKTSVQSRFRSELRDSIKALKHTGALQAKYITTDTRVPDIENVLFYNVGTGVFKAAANKILRFERCSSAELPKSPIPLTSRSPNYLRYEVMADHAGSPMGTEFAMCKVDCELSDLRKPARLWSMFKQKMIGRGGNSRSGDSGFKVSLTISASAECSLNLAEVAKPLLDGFVSALHCYAGNPLDELVRRVARELQSDDCTVRELLVRETHAVLGKKAVPNLRSTGIQWSPADDLLGECEIIRDFSAPIGICGRLFGT
jgi:hypothetical protein